MRSVLTATVLALSLAPAAAAGLETRPFTCVGAAGPRAGATLIVDGELAGIRLEGDRTVTYVIYGENAVGMALVNPLEHGLDQKADLARYSAVLQISAANVARLRARQGFVAALLSGTPPGSAVEVLRCDSPP